MNACLRAVSGVAGLTLLVALVALPSPAGAAVTGSIVFIRDGNVWITPADDPAAARAVTTDGTADAPYALPVMDSGGTIYAVTSLGDGIDGSGDIVRMDRSGNPIGAPFRPVTTGLIYSLDVSPDGETLGFSWAQSSTSGGGFLIANFGGFANADGSASSLPTDLDSTQPVFYANNGAALVSQADDYTQTGLDTYVLGAAGSTDWFATCTSITTNCGFPAEPDVAPTNTRLAFTTPMTDALGGDRRRLTVWEMPAAPTAAPTYACDHVIPAGTLWEPSWSPDGDALLWEEADGIHLAEGFGTDCAAAFAGESLHLTNATWATWSPASASGGTPTPTPTASSASPTASPTSSPDPGEDVVEPPASRAEGVTRFAGTDRYTTAAAVSRGSFPGSATDVFIVTGVTWPDALSAGPAAATIDAPVLPVQTSSIPAPILDEIDRLGPERAWIIGGTTVVTDAVRNSLVARGIDATRVPGNDRYSTAAAVTARFFPDAAGAYYASGAGYADALGGGAAAAERGWPLLLTAKDSVPAATPVIGTERIVLGGPAVISEAVRSTLGARRVAGTDRFSTAAAIALDAFDAADVVYLATGLNFPDALSGAVAAARDDAPLLLTSRDCVASATRDAVMDLGATSRVMLGGAAVVTDRAAALTLC